MFSSGRRIYLSLFLAFAGEFLAYWLRSHQYLVSLCLSRHQPPHLYFVLNFLSWYCHWQCASQSQGVLFLCSFSARNFDRNYELKKSIKTGRLEIGKRIASGSTTIENLEQSINAGADAEISKATLNIDVSEANRQETRRQMREIAKDKFYAQMRTFGKQRLVIMLHTCELLNEETAEAEATISTRT